MQHKKFKPNRFKKKITHKLMFIIAAKQRRKIKILDTRKRLFLEKN